MWAFRKRPADLSEEEQARLEALFEQIPGLELPYYFRQAVTEIFDTRLTPDGAAARFEELRELLDADDEDNAALLEFFRTFDAHREAILEYFAGRKTSGPVEGLNNKARVITKRCYGVKDTQTLWNRLCLDVNLASLAFCFTVPDIRAIAGRIRAVFLGYYT